MLFTSLEALLGWLILGILFYVSTSLILKTYDQGMQKLVCLIDGQIGAMKRVIVHECDIPEDSLDSRLRTIGFGLQNTGNVGSGGGSTGGKSQSGLIPDEVGELQPVVKPASPTEDHGQPGGTPRKSRKKKPA
jgi:hypothetical protein